MFKDGHPEYLQLTILKSISKDNTVQATNELTQVGSPRPHCPGFTGWNYAGSCLVFASERMLNNALQLSALFRILLAIVNMTWCWLLFKAQKLSFHMEIPGSHHAVLMFYCNSTRVRGTSAGKSYRGTRVYNVLELSYIFSPSETFGGGPGFMTSSVGLGGNGSVLRDQV